MGRIQLLKTKYNRSCNLVRGPGYQSPDSSTYTFTSPVTDIRLFKNVKNKHNFRTENPIISCVRYSYRPIFIILTPMITKLQK